MAKKKAAKREISMGALIDLIRRTREKREAITEKERREAAAPREHVKLSLRDNERRWNSDVARPRPTEG